MAGKLRLLACLAVALVLLTSTAPASAQTITVDNADAEFTILYGTWNTGAYGTPYGDNYNWSLTTDYGGDPAEVEWRPSLPQAGVYQVAIWYVEGTNRADNAPFVIHHAEGATPVIVNQQVAGETWCVLGSFSFDAGNDGFVTLGNDAHPSVVIADAVRFTWTGNLAELSMAVTPPGAGNTVPAEGGPYPYIEHQVVPISASPAAGYEFSHWSTSTGSPPADPAAPSTTVTMDEHKTVTAVFAEADPVELTMAISPPATGSTSPAAGGPYVVLASEIVPIAASPVEGYRFDRWEVSAGSLPTDPHASDTTVVMEQDKTVTALFVEGADASFRAFWADAFHSGFKSTSQIEEMVYRAVEGNYNAIIAEVLAYQDDVGNGHGAYWNSAILPKATDIVGDIDPLAYLVQEAHANGIEVHCWLVSFRVCTSWPPSGNSIMSAHPEWLMVPRSQMGGGPATVDGKYTLDPGSPDVQNYLLSIVGELCTNYEIDGIHWDYIRYTSTDAGYPSDASYSRSSLARFQQITGYDGTPPSGDAQWNDFRRRTITELIRRVMTEVATCDSPRQPLRHTAALITWGDAPSDFTYSSAYGIFQNWRHWMEFGYLDAGIPMTYYREYNPPHDQWYRNWVDASIGWRYARHLYTGPGIYLNDFEDSISQMQYALDAGADGLSTYSYASTGGGPSWYAYVAEQVFTEPVPVPDMPWRDPSTAAAGTVYGRVADGVTGVPIDDALMLIDGEPSGIRTDGNGLYVLTQLPASADGATYAIGASSGEYADVVRPAVLAEPAGFTQANLALGIWQPGDYDVDGDVDLDDYAQLAPCLTGPGAGTLPAGCDLLDSDLDGDIDLTDLRLFQTSFAP